MLCDKRSYLSVTAKQTPHRIKIKPLMIINLTYVPVLVAIPSNQPSLKLSPHHP